MTPALSAPAVRPVRCQRVKAAAAPPAVPLTRRAAADVLAQWQLETMSDPALLLEVWDCSHLPPVLQEADITGERGRGLMLVDFLADAWGHRPEKGGKVVWCELKAAQSAGFAQSCYF